MNPILSLLVLSFVSYAIGADEYLKKLKVKVDPGEIKQQQCGDELSITCVAQGPIYERSAYIPETQWWYRDMSATSSSASKIKDQSSDGKFSIVIEEFFVVRTTIKIKNATLANQGVYQCRGSNTPKRSNPGLQHWKITESHVLDVNCGSHARTSESTRASFSPFVSALTHAKKPTAGTDSTVATSTTTTTTANVSASSVSRQQFPPDQIVSTDDETETDSIASVTNSSSSRTTFSPFSTEVRSELLTVKRESATIRQGHGSTATSLQRNGGSGENAGSSLRQSGISSLALTFLSVAYFIKVKF